MIGIVWLVAFFVCIAPLLGWKDPQWSERVIHEKICIVSQDVGYQVFIHLKFFLISTDVTATKSGFLVPGFFQRNLKTVSFNRDRILVISPKRNNSSSISGSDIDRESLSKRLEQRIDPV